MQGAGVVQRLWMGVEGVEKEAHIHSPHSFFAQATRAYVHYGLKG